MPEKHCSLCKQILPVSCFGIRRGSGRKETLKSACIPCCLKQAKRNRIGKVYRYPKKDKELHLLRTYNLSTEQFDTLLASQNGSCAICKQVANRWHVDHCHTTDEVRSILCHHCNLMLGFARDSSTALRAGADYLDTFNANRRRLSGSTNTAA